MSRRPAQVLVALTLSAAAVSGCVVGPRYVPPTPPAPSSDGFAAANSAIAATDAPPDDWWRLYDDPALNGLVEDALVHNRSLLAAAANLAQARGALSLARSGLYPTTSLSAGGQYGVSSNAVFANDLEGKAATPSPNSFYTVGLDASYEVDLFGRVRRSIQAAAADAQAQQAALDVVRVSVAGETTRAYLNACAYGEELAVARQSLDLVTQTYQTTQAQARFGAASDFDLARAAEQVSKAQAQVPVDEGQRRTALFELAVLTGQPPEAISQAADACAAPPKLAAVLPVGDIRGLFARRPDVRQAERTLAAAVARIGVATADLYPTIGLTGSGGSGASRLAGLGSINNLTYGVGPSLSWSFPNTTAAQAEIREARATASGAYANFDAAVLQALQDVETSLATYGGELDHNAALNRAKAQSQTAFGLAQTQYRLGAISYLDLLTAQSDLVAASAALAVSDQALASDQVTVFKALGGGWAQAPAVMPEPIVDGRTGKATAVR